MLTRFSVVMMCLLVALPIFSQEDVIQAEFGEVYTRSFAEKGEEVFLQFEAEAGDFIYISGKSDRAGSTALLFEIRDNVGRVISYAETFPINPYAVAEIEADGMYTAVVTFDGVIAGNFQLVLDRTKLLDGDMTTFDFEPLSPPTVYGIKVDTEGPYNLILTRQGGTPLAMEAEVKSFANQSGKRVATYYGEETLDLRIVLELDADILYTIRIGSPITTTVSLPESVDSQSIFDIRLQPYR